MKTRKCFTWSLSSYKSPRNMSPGTLSVKFGLLDGNCYGVLNRRQKNLRHVGCVFTTDLEWSCRAWTLDQGFFRYLHVAAEKTYRSLGGHRDQHDESQRSALTAKGIKRLAREFLVWSLLMVARKQHTEESHTVSITWEANPSR